MSNLCSSPLHRWTALSEQSVTWLVAALLAGIGIISILGYDLSRPLFIAPVLFALFLSILPKLWPLRFDLSFQLAASIAFYMLIILYNIAFFHPETATLPLLKSWLMLGFSWSVFAVSLRSTSQPLDSKPLYLGLAILEAILISQIFFSYLTGWGEIIDSRDGMRRAYGWAGDGYSPVLVFVCLINLLRQKSFRSIAALIALFMTGGKMSLGLTLIAALLSLPLITYKKRLLITLAVGVVAGLVIIDPATHRVFHPLEKEIINTVPVAQVQKTQESPPIPKVTPPPETTSALTYLTKTLLATGQGRIISIGAGWEMMRHAPWTGVGFGQSGRADIFQAAVRADAFSLKKNLGLSEHRLLVEADISNQLMIAGAEMGIPGLCAFLILCALSIRLAFSCWKALRLSTQRDDTTTLVTACAIWTLTLVIGNQTAPWLSPAGAPTLLLSFALGICALWWRDHLQRTERSTS